MPLTHKDARPLRLGQQGRLVIPTDFRRALGVEPGDDLIAWVEEGQLVLRPRRIIEQDLWNMFAEVEGSLSEELIAERRAEAAREE